VPQTGIIDFGALADKLRNLALKKGVEIRCGEKVKRVLTQNNYQEIVTFTNSFYAKQVVCCAGLQSDRLARHNHPELPVKIIPFRGEYFKLKPEKRTLIRSLIYPVPDPAFPFLGVHFTRMINGGVEAGPNAVPAWKREGYAKTDFSLRDTMESLLWPGFRKIAVRYWRVGAKEMYRSLSKRKFVEALRKLVPEIQAADLEPCGSGVRAQACTRDGRLLDDFYIVGSPPLIHVCNAPSPAATASLAIGKYISDRFMIRPGDA
jgi:L-2-hydroxyglutarate oxidase